MLGRPIFSKGHRRSCIRCFLFCAVLDFLGLKKSHYLLDDYQEHPIKNQHSLGWVQNHLPPVPSAGERLYKGEENLTGKTKNQIPVDSKEPRTAQNLTAEQAPFLSSTL